MARLVNPTEARKGTYLGRSFDNNENGIIDRDIFIADMERRLSSLGSKGEIVYTRIPTGVGKSRRLDSWQVFLL